jgi:hypothetical protein
MGVSPIRPYDARHEHQEQEQEQEQGRDVDVNANAKTSTDSLRQLDQDAAIELERLLSHKSREKGKEKQRNSVDVREVGVATSPSELPYILPFFCFYRVLVPLSISSSYSPTPKRRCH